MTPHGKTPNFPEESQENDAKVQSLIAAFSWFLKSGELSRGSLTQENVPDSVDSSHGVAVFMLNDVLTYS